MGKTHSQTKVQRQRPVSPEDKMETDEQTDGDDRITSHIKPIIEAPNCVHSCHNAQRIHPSGKNATDQRKQLRAPTALHNERENIAAK